MQIIMLPSDIIKRCLWTKYRRFVLKHKKEDEINDIIKKNEPIKLSENDAYVIGLLKIIETTNLIYRFKLHIEDFLKIKSTIKEDKVMINKSSLLKEIIEFKDMFPEAFKPDLKYKDSIYQMKNYVIDVYKKIENLKIIQIPIYDKIFTYVYSNDIQKIIKQ